MMQATPKGVGTMPPASSTHREGLSSLLCESASTVKRRSGWQAGGRMLAETLRVVHPGRLQLLTFMI